MFFLIFSQGSLQVCVCVWGMPARPGHSGGPPWCPSSRVITLPVPTVEVSHLDPVCAGPSLPAPFLAGGCPQGPGGVPSSPAGQGGPSVLPASLPHTLFL